MREADQVPGRRRVEPILGWIALFLLLVGCVVVLRPFLSSLIWAMVLAYSLHPLQRRFTLWFRGSRTWAACFVTLTLSLVLAGPLVLIGISLAEDGRTFANAMRDRFLAAPDEAPAWVVQIPLLGDELANYWENIAADRSRWIEQLDREVEERQRPGAPGERRPDLRTAMPPEDGEVAAARVESPGMVYLLGRALASARTGLVAVGLAVGQGLGQILMSAFLAFFFLRDAPFLAARLAVVVDRLAGWRGQHLLEVAGDTVKSVTYGILGTALVQSLVAGVGFAIAGVPGAVLLGLLTFFLAVIPFGPPLVWLPASLWLFAQGEPGWGIFLLIWGGVGVSSVDNVLRPYLISQGSKMPFALIFIGVIGGAFAFGLVGVFLGPTLLAVAYRLIEEWSAMPPLVGAGETSGLPDGEGSAKPRHGGESIGTG
jgi:predicted PurR-regulated permease PerM